MIAERTLEIVAGRNLTIPEAQELARCAADFGHFLKYWHFVDERGADRTFAELWEGQALFVREIAQHSNIYALKAGKLGFTEIECAYDGWVARFRQPNARVHLFSMGQESSRSLLEKVRYGLERLPAFMRLNTRKGEAGADTSTSLKMYAALGDTRTIVSYPARPNVSIDRTATHAHLDEFARWPYGEQLWKAVRSTISPEGGTCHIITRGNGPGWSARVYRQARGGMLSGQDLSPFRAVFIPWDMRPRPQGWREAQARAEDTEGYIFQFAPATWLEALQGDETYVYPMWEQPPGKHIKASDPCPLAACKKIVITIDPGGTDPTALGLYGERSSGGIFKYAEWYNVGDTSADDIEEVLVTWEKRAGRRIPVGVPPDEPTLAATLKNHRFTVFTCPTDRDAGIRLVRTRLTQGSYAIHQDCKETAVEYEDYRAVSVKDATTKVIYAGDRPIKHHADCVDCDRYAILALAQGIGGPPVVTRTGTGRQFRS